MSQAWPMVPLGDIVAGLEAGVSVNGLDEPVGNDSEVGVLKVSCVSQGRFLAEQNKKVVSTDLERVAVSPRVGDIVISRANTLELVGASGYVTRDHKNLFLSDKLWRVRLRTEHEDSSRWLIALLNSGELRRELLRRATGTSGSMKNIGKESFLAIRVPRPKKQTQVALGEVFTLFEDSSIAIEQLGSAKSLFKRGLMQQLLTGQKRFPDFRALPWVHCSIGDVFEEANRPITWNEGDSYTLVSVRRRSGGLFLREKKMGSEIKVKALNKIRTGDILISKRQVVHGAIALVPAEFDGTHVSGEYMVLVPKNGAAILPQYFNHLTRTPRMYQTSFLASYGVDIEKLTFNPEWYLESRIFIPPTVEEQRRIADVLKLVDLELDQLARLRELIEIRKRGLLSRLLSGELKVPA